MAKNIERGLRELEKIPQSPAPESKLKTTAASVALTVSLLSSSKQSADLSQFSAQNIKQHRKNDITSEKSEVKARKRAFNAEDSRHVSIHHKEGLMKERSDIITSEYGSIKDYNIAKKAPDFAKSERLQGIETKINAVNKDIDKSSKKVRKHTAKADNILTARHENFDLRAGGIVYDKREVKEAKAHWRGFRAECKQQLAVDDKRVLLRERSDIIKSEYGSFANYNTAKKSAGFEKSAKLQRVEAKINTLDGEIRKQGSKFKQQSARAENLLDKRSQGKYFRQDGNSLTSFDKLERKAAKAEVRLAKNERLINHNVIRKSYQFDPETGKIKKKLIIDKEIAPLGGSGGIVSKGLKGAGVVTAVRLSASIHNQFSKHGSGTDSEKIVQTAARLAEHGTVKAVKCGHKFIQEQPYKRVSKLQHKANKANAKLYAKRKGGTARQMKKNAKQYMNRAKQARKAATRTEKVAQAVKLLGKLVGKLLLNPYVWLILGIIILVVLVLSMLFSMFAAIGNNGGAIFGAYFAEDEQIYAAHNYANTHATTAIQNAIDGVISDNPADEVVINPYTLGHNPYSLISFLSALSFSESGDEYDNAFNASDATIRTAIERFINTLYYINYNVSSYEVTYTWSDEDGDYEETVTYTVLTISVLRRSEDEVVQTIFNSGNPYRPDMYEAYQIYMETDGFRSELFPAYANN